MSLLHSNIFVLSRINKALRADFQHLAEADTELGNMLADVRGFGARVLTDALADPRWTTEWETIDSLIGEMRRYALKMREEMESDAVSPLAGFDIVVARDAKLHETLENVATVVEPVLSEQDRGDWEDLWDSVQAQMDVIRAYLAAVRSRIEMRRRHGVSEADALGERILSKLPENSNLAEADQFAEEYERAFKEFEEEKEKAGGLIGIFKSLLLIQEESPAAKARRRLHREAGSARHGE